MVGNAELAEQWLDVFIKALSISLVLPEATFDALKSRALDLSLEPLNIEVIVHNVNEYLQKHPIHYLVNAEIERVIEELAEAQTQLVSVAGCTDQQKFAIEYYNMNEVLPQIGELEFRLESLQDFSGN